MGRIMIKTKKENKTDKLIEILSMDLTHEFSNYTFEEKKAKIKEASEFIKQKKLL